VITSFLMTSRFTSTLLSDVIIFGTNFLFSSYYESSGWFMPKVTKLCVNLSMLCIEYCGFFFPARCRPIMSSSRKCTGRLFQTLGPAAAKFLSPKRKQTPLLRFVVDLLYKKTTTCRTDPSPASPRLLCRSQVRRRRRRRHKSDDDVCCRTNRQLKRPCQ